MHGRKLEEDQRKREPFVRGEGAVMSRHDKQKALSQSGQRLISLNHFTPLYFTTRFHYVSNAGNAGDAEAEGLSCVDHLKKVPSIHKVSQYTGYWKTLGTQQPFILRTLILYNFCKFTALTAGIDLAISISFHFISFH